MAIKQYKSKQEFLDLPLDKRIYYLGSLLIHRDKEVCKLPYRARLFRTLALLRKRNVTELSLLYSYLIDNFHYGLAPWEILPLAVIYDQQSRRQVKSDKQVFKQPEYNEDMLDSILGEDK